jgi:hypothetical protein
MDEGDGEARALFVVRTVQAEVYLPDPCAWSQCLSNRSSAIGSFAKDRNIRMRKQHGEAENETEDAEIRQ